MTELESSEPIPADEAAPQPRFRASFAIGASIFLLALVLRLVHLSELVKTEFFDERPFVVDARYYDMRAAEIAQGDLYGDATAYLSPMYCNVLGLIYKLPGFGLANGKYVQALLGALSALLVFAIGRKVFGLLAGSVAGFATAGYGLFIYYAGVLLPATLLLFLHLWLVWLLIAAPPTLWRMLGVGVLVGLAIGTKANALLLLPAIGFWLLYNHRETELSKRVTWIALLVLGAGVSVAPITYGNWKTSGEFVLVATTGGRNLLKGNGPTANGTHVEINLRRRTSTLGTYLAGKARPLAAVREDQRLKGEAIDYMLENPGRTAQLWIKKALLFVNRAELGIRDSFPFARTQTDLLGGPLITFGWIIPLGLAGLLLLAFRDRGTGLLSLVTATQLASFVLVFVLARYRVVAVALLIIFAGGLVAELWRSLLSRDLKKLIVGTLLIVLSSFLVHLPIDGIPENPSTGEQLEYLGERASNRGEYETAIEWFEKAKDAEFALNQQEGRWRVRERIGNCLELLERREDARKLWTLLYYEIAESNHRDKLELTLNLRSKLNDLDRPPE